MRIEKARQNGVLPAHQEGPGVELTLNMPGRKGYALLFPATDQVNQRGRNCCAERLSCRTPFGLLNYQRHRLRQRVSVYLVSRRLPMNAVRIALRQARGDMPER